MAALIRHDNPFREIEEMQDRLSKVFNEAWSSSTQGSLNIPAADVYLGEDEKNLIVETQLPGYSEDDVDISIDNGALSIRAEHSEKSTDKKKGRKYIVQESSSSLYRRVGLPKNVDADKIKANFEDGILKITAPMKDLPQPKKVAIERTSKNK
ncbi:MAG: Hsp20/alpha crystallin family protein [Candidatus Saccharimonadales bacterium]